MAAPQKPPNLDPNHIYIHVTSKSSPESIASSVQQSNGDESVHYVGPVGELSGEHIFEIRQQGQPVRRDVVEGSAVGQSVMAALKGVEGVKGAKVLEVKQRAKRGGDL